MVPKAELHCHIEGAAPPELVEIQARKYGADTSRIIKDGRFVWHDFTSFLAAYDFSSSLFRDEEDYVLLAHHYLNSLAADGTIYSEIFVSPDHAAQAGLSERAYVAALGEGIERARTERGIEGRMIVIGVRHMGVDAVERAARFAVECGHPLVTGFGMAGDERYGHPADYAHAFDIARDAGLGLTVHAGELAGAESVRNALDHLSPSRLGHGVRAIEDEALVARIAEEEILLEVCPGSNVALGVYPSFETHPFPELRDAGCRVTLNSDDPPYFATSLAREYEIAGSIFSLNDAELIGLTRAALEGAFVDEATRVHLLETLDVRFPRLRLVN